MCKRVGIELEGGVSFVDLFQKEFSIMHKQTTTQFKPGEYPEPCQMEIPNVEIFHVGLFLIVRIYQPNNPFFVKFEVSRIKLINKLTFLPCFILLTPKSQVSLNTSKHVLAVATFVTTIELLFNGYPGMPLNDRYREEASGWRFQ